MNLDDFQVKEYFPWTDQMMLINLFQKMDIPNNKNMAALGFKKRKNPKMFFIMHQKEPVAMSYTHDFSEYYPDTWRAFVRTATLPEFRTKGIKFQRNCLVAAGLPVLSLPAKCNHAFKNGAKQMYFTTNLEGDASSIKLGAYLKKIVGSDPRISYIEERDIYGVKQDVWKLNFKDLVNMKEKI